MSDEGDPSIRQTYRGLRLGLVVLVLLLFASVGFEIVRTVVSGQICLQPSISAYYYTPARPVFIAALCAVGAALIIYRGSTDAENVLLDFSGFFAFVVAFVPTRIGPSPCDTSDVPSPHDISAAVQNNVGVLLAVGLVAVVASVVMGSGRYTRSGGSLADSARGSAIACLAALLVGLVLFLLSPATFGRYGHEISATALFAGILAVVAVNAVDARTRPGAWSRNPYAVVGVVTVVVAAGTALAGRVVPGFGLWLFCVEAELIIGFGVFWVVQTVELGGHATRGAASASGTASSRS